MYRRLDLFVLVYTTLSLLVSVSMYLLGEQRIDAYMAVNVLMYYVSYAVIRPVTETTSTIKVLNIILVVVFTTIVAVRVYEVLTG